MSKYYRGELVSSAEVVQEMDAGFEAGPLAEAMEEENLKMKPRKRLRPLLVPATDISPPAIDWLGGSLFARCRIHVKHSILRTFPEVA